MLDNNATIKFNSSGEVISVEELYQYFKERLVVEIADEIQETYKILTSDND